MELLFRSLRAGEMERPPTQRDQFDNDDVELVDALVRESIQNSLDACDRDNAIPVRVCFNIKHYDRGAQLPVLDLIHAEQLNEHLLLTGLPALDRMAAMSVLTVEDFGTTGLVGRWDGWDEKPFCDFWRRMGRSHKGGQSLGRWGLGKLVFSSASKARIFLGLTIRNDDAETLVMGQAVLTHHKMPDGSRLDSHAFYAIEGEEDFQLPERDKENIEAFKVIFDLRRTSEPGLSIVVPGLRENITLERIIQGVLRNYFFPILFGRLEVQVGETLIDVSSFASLAGRLDATHFAGGYLASFIQTMKATRDEDVAIPFVLPADWAKRNMDVALGEQLATMRERLNDGEVVMVRAPLLLKRKDGSELQSFVDAFLQRAPADSQAMFVRGAIVLNAEHKYFRGRSVFAALVADDRTISEFLGDAENPAHTGWSASAEKVTANWKSARERLKDIRHVLQNLYNSLVSAVETKDDNALANVFSIVSEDGTQGANPEGPEVRPPVVPPIVSNPKSFNIAPLHGGFSVRSGNINEADLPLTIRVRTAYDVIRGNPFKKHDAADFDYTKNGAEIESVGATVIAESSNVIRIEVSRLHFCVNVRGFDTNRDLIIDPVKVS